MLSNPTQVILFDQAGFIIESSDTLFKAIEIGQKPVHDHFPFIESIFPLLFKLNEVQHFPRVEVKSHLLSGVYDFYIKTILKNNNPFVEWIIEDRTNEYDYKRVEQQSRQEGIIAQQKKIKKAFKK